MRSAARSTRWTVTVVAAFAVVLYFAAAIIHVGPLNPAKLAHGERAANALTPYFDQNWQLFAPDPISSERGILIRARHADGATTEWVDVTSEANAAARSRLVFSPRTSRVISNGLAMYLSPDPYRAELLERAEERGLEVDEAELELTPGEIEYQSNAVSMLTRYASAEALDRWGDGVDAVQVRILIHEFPPFSQRANWDSVGEIQTQDLDWQPVIREVAR